MESSGSTTRVFPLPVHPIHLVHSQDVVLSGQLLELLEHALGVRWPDWYRRLVLAFVPLIEPHQFWLPGGFLFARPAYIYDSTRQYQIGRVKLYFDENANPNRPHYVAVEWPSTHAIVGSYGDGAVVIDTSSAEPMLLNIYKEDYAFRPFFSLAAIADSPELIARSLLSGPKPR